MKLRNPWIDPRVARLCPEDVQSYLLRHGWKEAGPAENPHLLRYEIDTGNADAPTLFLPKRSDTGSALQWMIELIGELATWEGRFTGDVLTDILQPTGTPTPNGAAEHAVSPTASV